MLWTNKDKEISPLAKKWEGSQVDDLTGAHTQATSRKSLQQVRS
jgi:hypothetical protein